MKSPITLHPRRLIQASCLALAAGACSLALLPGPARASARACRPRVTLLPDLGYGGSALAIHGSTVVGFVSDPSGGQYPAVWRDGHLSTLSFDPGFAGDVNAAGEVVGTAEHHTVAFALSAGGVHLLPPSPTSFIFARRINDRGEIAGTAFDGNYAARWNSYDASPTRLSPAPGDAYSSAKGINDAGTVAGESDSSTHLMHPAIWSPSGAVTVFASAFGDAGDLSAVNMPGESAGESFRVDSAGDILFDQATAWTAAGQPTLVPLLPGTDQSTALNLNDRGWVVGEASAGANYATGDPGISHAFIWLGHGPALTLPVPGREYATSESIAQDVDNDGTVVGATGPVGGPDTATVWTCAARQAFVPQATAGAAAAHHRVRRHAAPATMRALFAQRRRLG